MQHPQPTPPAYYSELATLLADDAEPLPTDILDFIDELELHDCAGSAERRAGAPGSTSCAPEAQPAGKAQREPEGTSPERATDTGNASRIKRLRQRNREAQARFRLKQKGHRQQVEAKAQQTRAAIAETHKKIEALHETRKQLAKRQERADTMLEATLLLRAAVEQPAHAATARTWAARSDTAIPLRVSDSSAGDKPSEFTVSKPDTPVEGIAPQSLSAFHAHLPISYKSLQGTDDMPTFIAHPVSTRLYNCCVADGLSAKCEQYRLSQAAQQGVQHSQVAWFAQMHTEVAAGVSLSFSTTVASPSCAASFVLAFLTASMEAALSACLHDQQLKEDAGSPEPTEPSEQPAAAEPSSPAGNTDSPSPGQKRTRDAAALDTTATVQPASKEAATALPTKRISLDCYSPAHCASAGVGTGSSAHSDQHFLTELRIDRDGAPGGANTRMQTPSTAPSCGNYSCCNTAAVATRADEDANSTGSAQSAIHLPWGCSDKSVQHARATLARADSMHVSCSTKEQHNLVLAVKFVYKSVIARYCGHVCQNDIQKVCRKGLQVVEEMLKGIYMAVEAREEAMGGKTLCIHNRSHVPDDCRFFRGISEHIIGLLLTVQKEVRNLVHDLPAMVASAEAPTAESAAALQSHAVSVMLNARMGHMLVARDCTTVLGLLTIDVLVPLMECSEVDATVFKALKLKNGQRSAMATFWQQWKEYRRRLDDTATAAIEKLAGLPTTQPVPKATMDWINALCGQDEPAETEDAAAVARCTDNACCKPLYDTQPRESHCGAKGKARYLASRDRNFLQSKDLPQAQGTENLQREHLRSRLTTGDIMEGTQKPSTAEILEKGRGEKGFIGQSGHYATAAHTAIQMLTQMHRADKDLYINCLDAQMPAAVLSSAQVVQLWAATQMHDGFPFDFLNLCRMAYAQERRIQLLQKQKSPFLGQMLVL